MEESEKKIINLEDYNIQDESIDATKLYISALSPDIFKYVYSDEINQFIKKYIKNTIGIISCMEENLDTQLIDATIELFKNNNIVDIYCETIEKNEIYLNSRNVKYFISDINSPGKYMQHLKKIESHYFIFVFYNIYHIVGNEFEKITKLFDKFKINIALCKINASKYGRCCQLTIENNIISDIQINKKGCAYEYTPIIIEYDSVLNTICDDFNNVISILEYAIVKKIPIGYVILQNEYDF